MNYVYFFGFTNGKPFIPEIHNHTFSNTHSVLLCKLNTRYCINLSSSYFDEDAKTFVIYFCAVSIV